MMDNCIICQMHQQKISIPGGLVFVNEHAAVYHAAIPSGESTIYLGYMMIELKRHASGLAAVEEMADLLQLAQSPYFSIVSGNCFFSLKHVYPRSCREYALSTLHTLVTYC